MVTIGIALLYRMLLEEKNTSILSDLGISRDYLLPDELKLLNFINDYVDRYNKLPAIQTVEAELDLSFPDIPNEPLVYWADQLRERYISNKILEQIPNISRIASLGKGEDAFQLIKKLYRETTEYRIDRGIATLDQVGIEALKEHDDRQLRKIGHGIPFGFPYLDKISGGAQGGDFIPIAGRPSVGKTFIMQRMSIAAYDAGYTPMLVTTEMQPVQYVRRILALRNRVNPNKIRLGLMATNTERATIEKDILSISERENRYYIVRGSLTTTMSDVMDYVRDKRPDILYVDGAYLLETDNPRASQFEQITTGAKQLKLLAQSMNIPIICTYQFKRKTGESIDDIYQTDVIAQLASIAIGIHKDDGGDMADDLAAIQYRILRILKGREGEHGEIRVLYDMQNAVIEQVTAEETEDE